MVVIIVKVIGIALVKDGLEVEREVVAEEGAVLLNVVMIEVVSVEQIEQVNEELNVVVEVVAAALEIMSITGKKGKVQTIDYALLYFFRFSLCGCSY